MAQKTGNEETEFKVAPPCINSRAATKTPPPPETPPQITSSSSPSPLTSSSHSLTSSSPSSSMKSLMSASSRSSPVVTSHMLTNSSSPLEKASPPVMTSSSSPSHPSSLPVESQRCSQLTSSSPSMLTSSSPVIKLGDSAKEKRKLTEEEANLSIPTKRKVNRCSGCSKKVGLTGFRCRCGQLFCSAHRYSDRHDCSFDYKSAGREAIARENPVIKAAKILKI